ncbi:type II secretion system protein [Cerasicoccus frondis]|uniref:type II secretion system protein n=1 Tax=Cerasicoccus frondis TaxID=490090 RepID=UPI002852B7B6|nr:type II secretion system protein [Cerasicoccus frondis]
MNKNSKKGFTLVEIMIVVVIIGLLAAMAIPAFQKVREQSREKAITNNLRQIASAGQQYILEIGTEEATYTDLLNAGYYNPIQQVAGENYTTITVVEEGGTISTETTGEQVVVFTY